MFGIIYIVLSLLAGKELAEILLFTGKNAQEAGSRNGQNTGMWIDNVHDLLGGQRSRC